jgi:hypothetical protein
MLVMVGRVLVAMKTMRHRFSLRVACVVICSNIVGKRGW